MESRKDKFVFISTGVVTLPVRGIIFLSLLFSLKSVSNCTCEKSVNGNNKSTTIFKNLINIEYPVAPKEVQVRAESILNWFNSSLRKWERTSYALEGLKQALLTKAFRGELVPQDPDDEPASVLLEKIRKEMGKLGRKVQNQIAMTF